MTQKNQEPHLEAPVNSPQPNPTDVAMIAVQLAKIRENAKVEELIPEAYDLWQGSASLIKSRIDDELERQAHRDSERRKQTGEWMGRYISNEVTFDQIVSEGLLQKPVGEKSDGSSSLGQKGLEESIKKFFQEIQPVKSGVTKFGKLIRRGRLLSQSERWLQDILAQKKMSYELFEEFKRWRREKYLCKSSPESPGKLSLIQSRKKVSPKIGSRICFSGNPSKNLGNHLAITRKSLDQSRTAKKRPRTRRYVRVREHKSR